MGERKDQRRHGVVVAPANKVSDIPSHMATEICRHLDGIRLVVTGADGFIGRRVCNLTAQANPAAVFIGRPFDILIDELPLERHDIVVHLAAFTDVSRSWDDPLEAIKVNTLGTARILEQVRKTGASFIYTMTYPYGQPRYLPIDEDHPVAALTPYHLAKIEAEQIARFYAEQYGVPVTSLRLFNTYGPGQGSALLIGTIIAQLKDKTRTGIELATLETKRDFIFVDDVVHAIAMAAASQSGFRCFNVGSGLSHSVKDIVRIMRTITGDSRPITSLSHERRHQVMDVRADVTRIAGALGWSATVSLEDGLALCFKNESVQT